jgi:2',3'-cyclic-nucleotide 2'-phosphodiesterase (5'-nucleotidase family)
MKAFKLRSNLEVPALYVDAGNLFSDEGYDGNSLPPWVQVKNKWVVKSYGRFHHDAANITPYDLPYLAELLKRDGYRERLSELPFIKKLISANVRPARDHLEAPAPYLIREAELKRGRPGAKIKIGIIGFTEPKRLGPNEYQKEYAGFQVEDPFQAARQLLPELKKKVDLVIALAYMQQPSAQRLASENPEIDILVSANQMGSSPQVEHFGRASIVYAYSQTKYLGELRVYMRGDGSIENAINRHVALDEYIPDDPAAIEMVEDARNEALKEQSKANQ